MATTDRISNSTPETNLSDRVFVVHGRNHIIRDEVFRFLRSIGLRPFEWEQASVAGGMSAPHTLDIVKSGIEAAQAVIVLLTGDDIAKLHPAFGREGYRVQPRPNVHFEAGWALAALGQERTIFVSFGRMREISDIEGLNNIILSNAPESRKAFVERLRTAGCMLDDSGSDYLTVERGGDFEKGITPDEDPDILDRGRFTEVIADSTLNFAASNIELSRALRAELKKGQRVELKHHYLGVQCATNWLSLSRHTEYGHAHLKQCIARYASDAIDACKFGDSSVDLVSLGPGDGEIDEILLARLTKETLNLEYYYCIDISFELLQRAVSHIIRRQEEKGFDRRFRVKAIHGDFTELKHLSPIYTFDESINFFALNGFTFGNYNEAELLQSIRDGMEPGDFLFLDARLHRVSTDDFDNLRQEEADKIITGYKHQLNERFAFGPVECATDLTARQVDFRYEVNRMVTSVPMALNLITFCINLECKLRDTEQRVKWDRINLAATTFYNLDALAKWLPTRGFRVVWSREDGDIALFLLQRRDNSSR